MLRTYSYVGPRGRERDHTGVPRACITCPSDVRRWVASTRQVVERDGCVTTTFVVVTDGSLWVADRRSEHVACARGGPVLSAGEMTFRLGRDSVAVVDVTNQSTGYCPEPGSWPAVAAALDRAGVAAPDGFSVAYLFRRCGGCGSLSIVKDGYFECAACGADLPREWNCGPQE